MVQINISTKQKQTQKHREQTCGCQREGRRSGMDWVCGVRRCELFYLEWVNNIAQETISEYLISWDKP